MALIYFARLVPSDPSATSASLATAITAQNAADAAAATQALRESEARLRGLLEAGLEAVIIVGARRLADGTIERFDVLDVNERAADMVQRRREALLGQSLMALFPDGPPPTLWEQCCSVLITGRPLDVPLPAPTPEQPVRWLQRRLTRVHTDAVAISWRDMTTHELARLALEECEARQHDLFEGHGAVQLLADVETAQIIDANPAAVGYYGWPRDTMRAMYVTDLEAVSLERWRDNISSAAPGTGLRLAREHRLASGELRQVELCVGVAKIAQRRVVHFIIQDTTDRVRVERQLRDAESAGQLARAIAHDFNNLLTVIRGSTGFLREGITPASPDAEDLAAIERATESAVELTRRLLAVGRD